MCRVTGLRKIALPDVLVTVETNYWFVMRLFGADEAERPSLAQWKCFRGAWSAERGIARVM